MGTSISFHFMKEQYTGYLILRISIKILLMSDKASAFNPLWFTILIKLEL
jgi:hypothetical protein